MKLANVVKATNINIGGEFFALTPSLRAAYVLALREGGLEKLLKDLSENSVSAMRDVIEAAAGDDVARHFLNAVNACPLAKVIFDADSEFGLEPAKPLNEKLIQFILALLDINTEKSASESASPPKPQDFCEVFESLFEIATGWLGWSPDQAWQAAPAEIVAAHKGRVALLKAIFGSQKTDEPGEQEPDFARDPDAGMKLRALARV